MDKNMSLIVGGFIVLLMGAIFAGILPTISSDTTNKIVASETVNIAAARTAGAARGGSMNATYFLHVAQGCPYSTQWRADATCTIDVLSVKNSSGYTYTKDTDYTWYTGGTICTGANAGDLVFKNTTATATTDTNTTTVSYAYCGDNYVTQGWGRSAINVTYGLYAVGILLVGVGLFNMLYKDNLA